MTNRLTVGWSDYRRAWAERRWLFALWIFAVVLAVGAAILLFSGPQAAWSMLLLPALALNYLHLYLVRRLARDHPAS